MKFELNEKEKESYQNFIDEMRNKYSEKERYCGAIGGFFTISFTSTGLGYVIVASTILGDEKDITDYSCF